MSRRPGADKTAANQAVIKSLLKLPGNRLCSDCKRNKLPRWASWNLGVFICIRCSGIHRGMGTHISRVKSVDLDSWTDEQLQSMVKWGNSRANKYWEANLAPGHMPSEAKIENFIRTKYETKRWVMEGSIPDPSTLEESDDDNVPLKVVQQKLEQKSAAAAAVAAVPSPPRPQLANFDLIGGDDAASQSAEKLTTGTKSTQPIAKPADSLLGLDFFAPVNSAPPRPSSVNSDNGKITSSRPDLNRSILSLYSSAPKPLAKPQSPILPSLGSNVYQPQQPQQPSAFGDLNDSFGNLGFGALQKPPPQKPSPFANLTAGLKKTSVAAPQVSKPGSSGFFAPQTAKPTPSSASASSGLDDLCSFGAPVATQASRPAMNPAQNSMMRSLSFDADAWVTPPPTTSTAATSSNAWGTSVMSPNAWGSSAAPSKPVSNISAFNDDDWGDFDTGSTAPVAQAKGNMSSGLDDDLFKNVWK